MNLGADTVALTRRGIRAVGGRTVVYKSGRRMISVYMTLPDFAGLAISSAPAGQNVIARTLQPQRGGIR